MFLFTNSEKTANMLGFEYTNNKQYMEKHKDDCAGILFMGGADIHPSFYDDSSPQNICYSLGRELDIFDFQIAEFALENNIPIFGICRGMQLINVLNGDRLLHDIKSHSAGRHEIVVNTREIIDVNSLHHQMCIPTRDTIILARTTKQLSNEYIGFGDKREEWCFDEIEAIANKRTKSFGVQWHPEYMHNGSDGYLFFHNILHKIVSGHNDEDMWQELRSMRVLDTEYITQYNEMQKEENKYVAKHP